MTLPKGLITGVTARMPGDYQRQPDPPPRQGGRTRHESGTMNKTEAAYAWELNLRVKAGEIKAWWFEPFKLRLAKRCWYTVDFLVEHLNGVLECVEVKGHIEDDAAVKFRMAREMYGCFQWTMLKKTRSGWEEVLR